MKTDTAPDKVNKTWLKDYQQPDYGIRHTRLEFELSPQKTKVLARLQIGLAPDRAEGEPLILDGEGLELVAVRIDGQALAEDQYEVTDTQLIIPRVPVSFTLETEVFINPAGNTALSGLYMSNGMFCTQCEAEGFRHITYYMDRPDVLSTYDVRIEAEKAANPVLLANGNPVQSGDLPESDERPGWHFAEWSDPHPKPCYLFALVAGDLAHVEDQFQTKSGRDVTLRVFVQPENVGKCDYTLDALKRSMAWDEETFGREYDLDIFMIVAVDHFNFGAMENKGLNIFNSAYVLASPETATDMDYELIEGIVAHEYFHNWSGNRVTCRDWFQLCLKEGFTVFRDQEFSADQRSRPVQRIKDVRRLWQSQFPEDAGPLAHPVRPESYITIDNFYTATVYNKGAELVRMMKTLVGADDFRRATDIYFDRHDGEAATVDDFVICMEEASGRDLGQFRRWYSDAGTPEISVTDNWDNGNYTLTLTQKTAPTPGQPEKPARHIPVKLALVGTDGPLTDEELIELEGEAKTLTFSGLPEKPVPSLCRGFSAPVRLKQALDVADRLTLIQSDTDPFNRWSQAHLLAQDLIKSFAGQGKIDQPEEAVFAYANALGVILQDETLEPAFKAEILRVPTESDIVRSVEIIDPEAIGTARKTFRSILLKQLRPLLMQAWEANRTAPPYSPAAEQAGQRGLKNTALALLMAEPDDEVMSLIQKQIETADNMTDEAAAVSLAAFADRPEREQILAGFYAKWQHETLVVNKWLAWQALSGLPGALAEIQRLMAHEAFDLRNPNKVRALIGAFAMENPGTFHLADGSGYAFFFDRIRELDPVNPQVAARLLTATENWRRLEPGRRGKLSEKLKALCATEGLSKNVYEMAERLADGE
ncbi:aminopeptidase N [Parvularcula sp. IMCC14364]|uniref:aminopeptidase N n=1 Tax=Parvularcula sp. IMCC14364 TaxID=3067902 RepID=UPI0027417946|nr:aminopeptidase N [Parvularcula sp. IMCC14364]